MSLELCPVSFAEAKAFVLAKHRHHKPPVGWKFGVGVAKEGELVGVAMAGRPVARKLDDGFTLEVNRTCTTGEKNANSMLYGAIRRAAKALGYRELVTYTLLSESGASLKAAGWKRTETRLGGLGPFHREREQTSIRLGKRCAGKSRRDELRRQG